MTGRDFSDACDTPLDQVQDRSTERGSIEKNSNEEWVMSEVTWRQFHSWRVEESVLRPVSKYFHEVTTR